MATGKTTIGHALAAKLGLPMFDVDDYITKKAARSVAEIFQQDGEEYFRNLESMTLRELSAQPAFVLATGGGAPCFSGNLEFMLTHGTVIALVATPAEILRRLASDAAVRPLLAGADVAGKMSSLLAQRETVYSQAQITIDTTDKSVEKIVDEILEELRA